MSRNSMDAILKFNTPIIIFLLTLASGVWLSHSGKPLNTVIFTIHKLIALAAVVITSMQIYNIFKNMEIQSILITLVIVAGLCVLALFVSGALMSVGLQVYDLLLNIHKMAMVLIAASMALIIYILSGVKL